jgi:excisionase family DNA binding protein
MVVIGKKPDNKGLKEFITVKDAAQKLKVKVPTLKRWLKDEKITGVVLGRNNRGWILVHRNSLPLIRQYRDKVEIQKIS